MLWRTEKFVASAVVQVRSLVTALTELFWLLAKGCSFINTVMITVTNIFVQVYQKDDGYAQDRTYMQEDQEVPGTQTLLAVKMKCAKPNPVTLKVQPFCTWTFAPVETLL